MLFEHLLFAEGTPAVDVRRIAFTDTGSSLSAGWRMPSA
jgi:hypothetical protein